MGSQYNTPQIITDKLTLCYDASNIKSYPGSGTLWKDLSVHGYHCVLENGPAFDTDHFTFDGTNDRGFVKTLNYNGGNTISEMSVFAWIRTTYNVGDVGVWDNNNWALLDFDRSSVFTFALAGSGEVIMSGRSANTGGFSEVYDLIGTKRNNDGNFHYVGYTFSVANQKVIMYVDGEVDRTHSANGNMSALGVGGEGTRFGLVGDGSEAGTEGAGGNSIFYDGDIAIIHFYDTKVLTAAEVKQNYDAVKGRFGL